MRIKIRNRSFDDVEPYIRSSRDLDIEVTTHGGEVIHNIQSIEISPFSPDEVVSAKITVPVLVDIDMGVNDDKSLKVKS